ncbi:hypothetical protein ENSA5_41560 [Enhygromyxa salina]|uniref:Uncharacterized protein n=1 Tax=Enhygromyxa salina TaxID=215803 RepID=A0A2S9XMD3_9BACT|nr:hypothetical protein [Enhygromyxa salina]PRP94044.1 hypothetical protein ENSA5_41560 [Enhygromyxa salina]
MPSNIETLLAITLMIAACPAPPDEDPTPQRPDPIGDELLRIEGTWASPACARSHLYRDGREVQYQCLDVDGVFSWENRGTLTPESAAALDTELATADLDDTVPVNYMGLCEAADASGTVTMWVGEDSVSFAPFCLFEGIVSVFEEIWAIETDLAGCQEPFSKLESVEPGCRA